MIKSQNRLTVTLIILFFLSCLLSSYQVFLSKNNTETSSRTSFKDAIAVIPVYGPVSLNNRDLFSVSGIDAVRNQLMTIAKKPDVKAVILRVNSPGGPVGSAQELFKTIETFKKNTQKPVVVSIVDVGASGAYWASLAADYIFALPGSLVGSLGVIIQAPDFTEVKDRYGIDFRTYTSGKMKDTLNPWRPVSQSEEAYLKKNLAEIHLQFVEVVHQRRNLSIALAKELADGRVYSGKVALEKGLVDALGGLDDAISYTAKLAKIPGKPRVIYPSDSPFKDVFRSLSFQSVLNRSMIGFDPYSRMVIQ